MADEQQVDQTPPFEPFHVGSDKVEKVGSDHYYGGKKVSVDATRGLPEWVGNESIKRDGQWKATEWGGQPIVREGGKITKIGEKKISWKEEERLRRFLDGE